MTDVIVNSEPQTIVQVDDDNPDIVYVITQGPQGASGAAFSFERHTISSSQTLNNPAAPTWLFYFCTGNIIPQLPTAIGNGNIYTIKNIGNGVPVVTPFGTQKIEESNTAPLNTHNEAITIFSDGADWRQIC